MTNTTRWLDELSLDAPERALLLAGKEARPPAGAVDADWQALCVAVTATVAVSSTTTGGIAANSVAAKSASVAIASKAAGVTSWVVGAKWFVMGAALGCGVAGASAVVQQVARGEASRGDAERAPAAVRLPSPQQRSAHGAPAATPNAAETPNLAVATAFSEPPKPAHSSARPDESVHVEPVVAPEPGAASAVFPSPPALAVTPLSEQARELAEVKRLIDAGSAARALTRLDATRRAGAPFALSEERDALYVQALAKAQRRADARLEARAFLIRYPASPYLETMRRLLADE